MAASVATEAPRRDDKRMIDPELLRQAAQARRREKEAEELARKAELARAKKQKIQQSPHLGRNLRGVLRLRFLQRPLQRRTVLRS